MEGDCLLRSSFAILERFLLQVIESTDGCFCYDEENPRRGRTSSRVWFMIKKLTSPADLIDPNKFLETLEDYECRLTTSQEAALKYLTEMRRWKTTEAQTVVTRRKKYGHSLPTAFDMKVWFD